MKRKKSKFPLILASIGVVLTILILTFFISQTTTNPPSPVPETTDQSKIVLQDEPPTHKNADLPDVAPVINVKENVKEAEAVETEIVNETIPVTSDNDQQMVINPNLRVQEAIDNLNNFFVYLDNQEYIQALNLPKNSKETFSALVQKLVDNPPVVSGEADDLFTLLKNTAHFFRVLGENNIILLKEIFVHEADKIEPLAEDLYVILGFPEKLATHYNIQITDTALYEYSSFLMNTMGGRLYMFRRDMEIRMLVSYYSILFVEQAEEKGLNNHGLDVMPFVINLIKEVENHGQRLVMRDTYLERLYEIDQRTNR